MAAELLSPQGEKLGELTTPLRMNQTPRPAKTPASRRWWFNNDLAIPSTSVSGIHHLRSGQTEVFACKGGFSSRSWPAVILAWDGVGLSGILHPADISEMVMSSEVGRLREAWDAPKEAYD